MDKHNGERKANGECQGEGENELPRKRKDRGEDGPKEAGAASGADADTQDLGIANPPTPAPTEANAEGSMIPRAELFGAMKCVSHMNFNGNPSFFADAEVHLARDATTLFLPESDSRFLIVFTHIASRVAKMIGWYGDDGYGDKPKEMPRFTYWFQTFQLQKIFDIVEHLQERPAKLSIVCIVKPASSAPKCYICKDKLVRGDFALQEREYDHRGLSPKMAPQLVEIISQTNSKEWDWRVRGSKMRCLKKGCVGCSPMPVVVVVPSGKEEAARTAIHAVWP
jgi:hypothetical protein